MIFGQFGDMVKQAKELQSNLKKVKDELARMRYEAEVGGVKVVVSGELDILEVKVGQSANLSKVDAIFKETANKALKAAKDDAAERLKKATGGIQLPGM
ncbi:MAG: YbaB/EbfC family nucleoid-associated protein [Candidatus Margulisiibacteriota bacterium]